MIGFFLSPLGKLIGIGTLGLIIGGIGAGWAIHTIDNGSYQQLVAKQATQQAAANAAALAQVETWARTMHDAAAAYVSSQGVLTNQIDGIQRELRNVQIRKPLVAGCAPDADRVHSINAAAAASNAATVGN